MEHQLVALAVLEERGVAYAREMRDTVERDASCFELAPRLRDIGDAQCNVGCMRSECRADCRGVDQVQRDIAGLDLRPGSVPVRAAHPERVAVERLRAFHVPDRHGVEVGSLDLHASERLTVAATARADLVWLDAARCPSAARVAAARTRRVLILALRRELLETLLHRRRLRRLLGRQLLLLRLPLSQRSPPSGAESAGSSRRRTPAAAPS